MTREESKQKGWLSTLEKKLKVKPPDNKPSKDLKEMFSQSYNKPFKFKMTIEDFKKFYESIDNEYKKRS